MQVSPFRRMTQCWGQDHISILDCCCFGSTPASDLDDALSEFQESTLENRTYWGIIPLGREETQFLLSSHAYFAYRIIIQKCGLLFIIPKEV